MKPLLITVGSRGDVQPYVALARALLAAGHDPVLAAPRRFAPLAEPYRITFVPLIDEMLDLQDSVKGKGARAAITAARSVKPMVRRLLDEQAALAECEADVVVYHPKSLGGPYVAERLGVPAIAGLLVPLYVPTADFANPIVPVRLPRALNRASWRLTSAVDAPYRGTVRAWRAEALGLKSGFRPMASLIQDGPVLHAWSPHLLPAPPDWPPHAQPTGCWTLPADDGWTPPERLQRFLVEGEPPVYVGFGSMVGPDPATVTDIVVDAIRLTGRRAVLATGWGGLRPGTIPDGMIAIDEVPHSWLLPRVAAAVHHGGIGTVAAALRAGTPQVIRPFIGDQPFWAERLHRLGVSPGPVTDKLTAERLAAAIMTAATLVPAAQAVARQVNDDDGLTRAVGRIRELCSP